MTSTVSQPANTAEWTTVLTGERARQAAFQTGYDDYVSGAMAHADEYRSGPLAVEYEKGAASAVFDVDERKLGVVERPVGRKYKGQHRRTA